MKLDLNLVTVVLYNIVLLAGTAYLVAEYNWSAAWFILVIFLLGSHSTGKKNDKPI